MLTSQDRTNQGCV